MHVVLPKLWKVCTASSSRTLESCVQLWLRARLFLCCTAQFELVEALRYKPEGRGFDSRWCHWNWSFSFRPHYGPGVDSASNRKEYQEYFLGVKAAGT